MCASVSSLICGSRSTCCLQMNNVVPYDRDSFSVSHFTLHSTKRSSAAPACKIPCPLLLCSNTRQRKWPFCVLVWWIHHWLLSDGVLDEWDHLSVRHDRLRQRCDSLGNLSLRGYVIAASWHGLEFAERCIIDLQTSNVLQTGRNFLGQLWGKFFQPPLWVCTTVTLPLQNKGAGYERWEIQSGLGICWQNWKLREELEKQRVWGLFI